MRIAIIGAGITGLTTALALDQYGIPYRIFEKAPELNEVGAGILLQPNALNVFDRLGFKEELLSKGVILDQVAVTDDQMRPIRSAATQASGLEEEDKILSIHRGKLQKFLYEQLKDQQAVQLAHPYRDHLKDAGEGVLLKAGDSSYAADVILAADGIHSAVRKKVFPESSLRYAGQTCWRGIANIGLPDEWRGVAREAWGRKVRFGISPVGKDQLYWFAVINAPAGGKDDPNTVRADLHNYFGEFHSFVHDAIDATPPRSILRNDIFDLNRLRQWHQGDVCLMGDAAHATTPNMGQGAGQGIEDAFTMGYLVQKMKQPKIIFETFERHRRKKVDYVVNNSWRFGKLAHQSLGQWALRKILRWVPQSAMDAQMQKLYKVSLPKV